MAQAINPRERIEQKLAFSNDYTIIGKSGQPCADLKIKFDGDFVSPTFCDALNEAGYRVVAISNREPFTIHIVKSE